MLNASVLGGQHPGYGVQGFQGLLSSFRPAYFGQLLRSIIQGFQGLPAGRVKLFIRPALDK
jgi:hypothetical protein